MGVFKYFPMECRHGVVSMCHETYGSVNYNGVDCDFIGGIGYIETDSGTSFPKSYVWVQCNSFPVKCSVMVSIADVPFMGFKFKGCICIIHYNGREYRLATYLGVKIERLTEDNIVLKQRNLNFEIKIKSIEGHPLYAPTKGKMNRMIRESPSVKAKFRLFDGEKLIFDLSSDYASYEYSDG